MPAPRNKNKARHAESTKALALAKLDDGESWDSIIDELEISRGILSRWINQAETPPGKIEQAKSALSRQDYAALRKSQALKHAILDEILNRSENQGFKEMSIEKLSRTGVELAKIEGITWDKLFVREGGIPVQAYNVNPDRMLAMLMAKSEADRAAAERYREERKRAEELKDVIDIKS